MKVVSPQFQLIIETMTDMFLEIPVIMLPFGQVQKLTLCMLWVLVLIQIAGNVRFTNREKKNIWIFCKVYLKLISWIKNTKRQEYELTV